MRVSFSLINKLFITFPNKDSLCLDQIEWYYDESCEKIDVSHNIPLSIFVTSYEMKMNSINQPTNLLVYKTPTKYYVLDKRLISSSLLIESDRKESCGMVDATIPTGQKELANETKSPAELFHSSAINQSIDRYYCSSCCC